MNEDWEETLDVESKDSVADRHVTLTLVPRVEAPTPAGESKAQFERLMQAVLEDRRNRERRRRRLIAYALSSATAILAFVAILWLLFP